jgi:HEAT repeat protein
MVLCVVAAGMLHGCAWRPQEPVEAAAAPAPTAQERALYAKSEGQLYAADAATRERAAVSLLSTAHSQGVRTVLDAMRHAEDPAVRASIVRAIAFCVDHRCFQALLAAMDDPQRSVQEEAAAALARFTRPEELQAVMAYVTKPGTLPSRRCLIYTAFGSARAIQAVPVLLDGLHSSTQDCRDAAWQALRAISRRSLPADAAQWRAWWEANSYKTREDLLQEHLQAVAAELQEATGRLGELESEHEELVALIGQPEGETLAGLVEALGSEYAVVRRYSAARLAALPDSALGQGRLDDKALYISLREAFERPSEQVRLNVMRLVARLDGQYREPLVAMVLSDPSPSVAVAAIDAVSGAPKRETISVIEGLVRGAAAAEVRVAAAKVLGRTGSQESIPALLGAVDDSEEDVRWFAVEGLRKLGATHAVPRISQALQRDRSARVREVAASALGELGQPAAVPALRRALDDPEEHVREKASAALLTLATDSYERMMVIAEAFAEQEMFGQSQQVLERVIEQFGPEEGMVLGVVQATIRLAEIVRAQQDLDGAIALYADLDGSGVSDIRLRRGLTECLLEAGRPEQAVTWLTRWVDARAETDLLTLAVETAERFLQEDRQQEAMAIVEAVQMAGAAAASGLTMRIKRLQVRLAADAVRDPSATVP